MFMQCGTIKLHNTEKLETEMLEIYKLRYVIKLVVYNFITQI